MPTARPRTPLLALSALLLVGLLAGGYALIHRDSSADASSASTPVGLTPEQAKVRLASLAQAAPPAQRAAFTDGAVSRAEYEAAVRSTLDCLRSGATEAAGGKAGTIEVTGPTLSDDEFEYLYEYSVDEAAVPDSSGIERRCQQTNLDQVADGYKVGRLADTAYVRSVVGRMHRCLDDGKVPGAASNDVRDRVMQALSKGGDDPVARSTQKCLVAFPSINELH